MRSSAFRSFRYRSHKEIRGSLTLEAAVVFPLYLFFFMALLSVSEMLQFSSQVQYELSHAAKEIAVYLPLRSLMNEGDVADAEQDATGSGGNAAGSNVSGIAETVLADLYTEELLRDRLSEEYRRQMGVTQDLSLLQSKVMLGNDLVDLAVTYGITPRCNVFFIPQRNLTARARTHAWTGYDRSGTETTEDGERIVYVTESGSVYHLSRSCTHLDLSIRPIPVGTQGEYRNSSGGNYRVCEVCGGPSPGQEMVYITNEGDRYHSSLTCSGLKRTIYEIPISQAGGRRVCSRCGGTMD